MHVSFSKKIMRGHKSNIKYIREILQYQISMLTQKQNNIHVCLQAGFNFQNFCWMNNSLFLKYSFQFIDYLEYMVSFNQSDGASHELVKSDKFQFFKILRKVCMVDIPKPVIYILISKVIAFLLYLEEI